MPTTITVDDETLERFKRLKAELDDAQADVPDHTNESFLQALMDTWESDPSDADLNATATITPTLNEDALDEVVGEVEGALGEAADAEAIAREVARRFDYAALADQTAAEVARRLQG